MRSIKFLLTSKITEWVINGVILAYAVVLGSESFVPEDSTIGLALSGLERALLLLLCAEVALRCFYAAGSAIEERSIRADNELRTGWFYFDVITTVLGFIPGFEAFRAYRLLRLIGRFEFFKHPIELLVQALRKSLSLVALAGCLVAVNGLVSTTAFGTAFPDEVGRLDRSILSSLFLVFFDDLGNRYLMMYSVNPVAMILHTLVTLLVGVLVMALFVSTVLEVQARLKEEREEREREQTYKRNSA